MKTTEQWRSQWRKAIEIDGMIVPGDVLEAVLDDLERAEARIANLEHRRVAWEGALEDREQTIETYEKISNERAARAEAAETKLRLAVAVVEKAREGFRAEREEYESAAIHRAWKALKESIRAFDGTEGSDDKDT